MKILALLTLVSFLFLSCKTSGEGSQNLRIGEGSPYPRPLGLEAPSETRSSIVLTTIAAQGDNGKYCLGQGGGFSGQGLIIYPCKKKSGLNESNAIAFSYKDDGPPAIYMGKGSEVYQLNFLEVTVGVAVVKYEGQRREFILHELCSGEYKFKCSINRTEDGKNLEFCLSRGTLSKGFQKAYEKLNICLR